jgi:hypothetical protein
MKSLFYAGFACLLAVSISCSDSKTSDPISASDVGQIGSKGGTVTEGDASVEVPKGALSSPTKIGVAVSKVTVAAPDGYELVGPAIAFTPHGLTFDVPVTLTLPYTSSSTELAVLRLEDEKDKSWEVIEGGTFAKGSATLEVTTFSIYAVAAVSAAADGAGGAGGMSAVGDVGGAPDSAAGASSASDAGAPAAGGAPPAGDGDLTFACDRMDTDGNGLRICSDYFYPALVVQLAGGQIKKECPGAGNGVLLDACVTTGAVAGCFTHDVDGLPGVNVTNWFYAGTKVDLMNGKLCTETNSSWVDPP